MKKIKVLFEKYKELLLYIVFGAGTTVVNFLSFSLFQMLLGKDLYLLSNGLAWIAAVVFAYVTNKLWVFESKSWKPGVLWREVLSFVSVRGVSFGIEEVGLLVLVEWLRFGAYSAAILGVTISGAMIAKLLMTVIVVILNYCFSKLVVFKK